MALTQAEKDRIGVLKQKNESQRTPAEKQELADLLHKQTQQSQK